MGVNPSNKTLIEQINSGIIIENNRSKYYKDDER